MNLTPEVARRKNRAVEQVTVRRLRSDRSDWKCVRYLYGTVHCLRPAMFLVEGRKDFAYCWGCLMFALKEMLLAPDEEYLEESREQFDHSMSSARIAAHSGCTGRSKNALDGLCHAPVIATCANTRQFYRPGIGNTDKTCGPKCARHAERCRKRHGLLVAASQRNTEGAGESAMRRPRNRYEANQGARRDDRSQFLSSYQEGRYDAISDALEIIAATCAVPMEAERMAALRQTLDLVEYSLAIDDAPIPTISGAFSVTRERANERDSHERGLPAHYRKDRER